MTLPGCAATCRAPREWSSRYVARRVLRVRRDLLRVLDSDSRRLRAPSCQARAGAERSHAHAHVLLAAHLSRAAAIRGSLESRLRVTRGLLEGTSRKLASGESRAGTLCRALAWQVVQGRLPARHGRRASSRRAPGHQARRHRQSFRRRECRREHSARCAQPLVSSLTPLWVPNLTPIASSFGRWLWQVIVPGVYDRCFTSGHFDRSL